MDIIKKRGRKPKTKNNDIPIDIIHNSPKRRGRKPNSKLITSKDISVIEDDDNCIIVKLPLDENTINDIIDKNKNNKNNENNFSNDCIKNENLSFESNLINKNNEFDKNYITQLNEEINCLKAKILEYEKKENNDIFYSDYSVKLLDNLTDNKYNKEKNIKCWWCCHEFKNNPFFLPDNYENNKFNIYGYFCSPSCAVSYNFDINDDKIWKRYSLIIKLYNLLTDNNTICISPAPVRQTLECFGGYMTIEQFRKINPDKIYNSRFLISPAVPIKTLIEESYKERNKYDWDNKINISKLNNLKKSIDTKSRENNLEKIMGIKKLKL